MAQASEKLLRVLLVEDDEDLRETIAEALREDGYDVITAGNGAEALRLLNALPRPSIVVTDLMMPVMSGWELVSRIRAEARLAALPVVAVSAVASRTVPGCDGVIKKPVPFDVLSDTIAKLAA